jgi:hypothetical protein
MIGQYDESDFVSLVSDLLERGATVVELTALVESVALMEIDTGAGEQGTASETP